MKKFLLLSLLAICCLGAKSQNNYNIILHSPQFINSYMYASVIFNEDATAYISYNQEDKTDVKFFKVNEPQDFLLEKLSRKDTNSYKLHYSFDGGQTILESEVYNFEYPSKLSENFCFTISSFSSLVKDNDSQTLNNKLEQINAQKPLFHIDLGDNFDLDKYPDNYKESLNNFLYSRNYYGTVAASSELFLVNGDTDGLAGKNSNATKKWAAQQKQIMFPSTNEDSYYSITYGEAQIIVLDPYCFTPIEGASEPWARTLGKTQYEWLKSTLKKSKATHKFVFIHDIFGSNSQELFEWGGKSQNSSYDFDTKRKGWKKTIHTILKEHQVKAVFCSGEGSTSIKVDQIDYITVSKDKSFKVEITPESAKISDL